MEQSVQIDLIQRILMHVRDASTERSASERVFPTSDYLSEGRFNAEVAMMRRAPLIASISSRIARPGDYVTLQLLGLPVLIVRGPDCVARAFLNVCRHRAARLLSEDHGCGLRRIVCPYHSWSYNLSGQLTAIPDGDASFPEASAESPDLTPLHTEEHHGFIWVGIGTPSGANSDFLGPLDRDLASFDLKDYLFYSADSRVWNFNWKTSIEAYLENYHFASLHRGTTSKIFINNLSVVDQLGVHTRAIAPKRSIIALAKTPESSWRLRPHATLFYLIFPNTCLFVEKSHFSLLQAFPEGPTKTRVNISHAVQFDGLANRDFWEENIAVFMSAVDEDLGVCESATAGMSATGDGQIRFGRNEIGCSLFRDAVDASLMRDEDRRDGPAS